MMNTIEIDTKKTKLAHKMIGETDSMTVKSVATDEYLTSDEFWNASRRRLDTICHKHGILQ